MLTGIRIVNMEVLKIGLKSCLLCQAGEVNFVDFFSGKNRPRNKPLAVILSSAPPSCVNYVIFRAERS